MPRGEYILNKGFLSIEDIPEKPTWLRKAVLRTPRKPKRVWRRKIFVMGTYDPKKRNLEVQFYAPVSIEWDIDEVEERVKDIMFFFLKKADYDIPVWDEDRFGVSEDRQHIEDYSESDCPNFYKILIIDYDYNTTRAEANFEWDINWLEDIEGLKEEIEKNLIINRGTRTGRPKIREGQTRLIT